MQWVKSQSFNPAKDSEYAWLNSHSTHAAPSRLDNTLAEFDHSGSLLERIFMLFHNFTPHLIA